MNQVCEYVMCEYMAIVDVFVMICEQCCLIVYVIQYAVCGVCVCALTHASHMQSAGVY